MTGSDPQDDGTADPALAAALTSYDAQPAVVWAALAQARVFLALEARLGSGQDHDRGAEMVLLGLTTPSGARALPAFLDGHQVPQWQPAARPVRLTGPEACRAALDDGADVLLLDPAGVAVALPADVLRELAAGRVPVSGAALSTLRARSGPGAARGAGAAADASTGPLAVPPDLVAALGVALRPERSVGSARLVAGPDGPVLGLVLRSHLPAAELLALADRVRARLGDDLPPDGLDLAELGPTVGPGVGEVAVPLGRRWWQRS